MKAVVFIDVQKDFIDGALRNEKAIEVTPKIVKFAKKIARKKSEFQLFATRDTHEKTEYKTLANGDDSTTRQVPCAGYLATLEGQNLPVEHCIKGTNGWQIVPELQKAIDEAHVVDKLTFGSMDLPRTINSSEFFQENEFGRSYDEIILVGFCTDICVVSNAMILRAAYPNKKITVFEDLCAGVTEESHKAALATMRSCQIDIKLSTET